MQAENLKLSDSQLEAFLHKSGFPEKLVRYFEQLPSKISYPVETILDCGGGNGEYLDLLLEQFPNAQGTLVDSAQFMLDQNKPHARKHLILGNLDNLSNCVKIENRGGGGGDRQFYLICFSDVLHLCIDSTYQETRNLQTTILKNAKTLLSPNGSIIVSERIVNSWLPYDYSTRLIYNLTRSKSIASIIKLLGANTAGVGVAFMSRERFEKLCNDVGLTMIEEILISENKKYSIKSMLTTSVRYCGLGISSLTHRLFRLTIK
ncbi:MAG: class I SAM-dependent methyltransferase [Planctomycetaceae bacterium]|jgi:SAM-dependent methyltransferase|nr:class I SAM-dependent methyltransferase [Planctomycetaceae bacterium]